MAKEQSQDSGRSKRNGVEATKCRDPVSTKVLRKRAKWARRELDARFGALSQKEGSKKATNKGTLVQWWSE